MERIRDIKWRLNGKPVPDWHIKRQKVLHEFMEEYKIKTFVETGTYRGWMIDSMLQQVLKIYSIELSRYWYLKAKLKYKNHHHVTLIRGDSGKELKQVIDKITEPCLFWLDGHYTDTTTAHGDTETPILKELHHILSRDLISNVIIIDDAHEFSSNKNYPSIEKLREYVRSYKRSARFHKRENMIIVEGI